MHIFLMDICLYKNKTEKLIFLLFIKDGQFFILIFANKLLQPFYFYFFQLLRQKKQTKNLQKNKVAISW